VNFRFFILSLFTALVSVKKLPHILCDHVRDYGSISQLRRSLIDFLPSHPSPILLESNQSISISVPAFDALLSTYTASLSAFPNINLPSSTNPHTYTARCIHHPLLIRQRANPHLPQHLLLPLSLIPIISLLRRLPLSQRNQRIIRFNRISSSQLTISSSSSSHRSHCLSQPCPSYKSSFSGRDCFYHQRSQCIPRSYQSESAKLKSWNSVEFGGIRGMLCSLASKAPNSCRIPAEFLPNSCRMLIY